MRSTDPSCIDSMNTLKSATFILGSCLAASKTGLVGLTTVIHLPRCLCALSPNCVCQNTVYGFASQSPAIGSGNRI